MTRSTSDQLAPTMTTKDLKGFAPARVALIREMESYGWRGRRSTPGHAIMRAPDGETTASISPKVTNGPRERNVAQEFRGWLRQQQERMTYPTADAMSVLVAMSAKAPAGTAVEDRPNGNRKPLKRSPRPAEVVEVTPVEPVDTAPEPEPVAVLRNTQQACGLCEKPFATLQALSVHRVRVHSKVACEVCDQPMSPGNLPRHLRKHVEVIGTHEQAMREVLHLRAELAHARGEAIEWERMADEIEDRYTAVKDRLDNAVGYLLGAS